MLISAIVPAYNEASRLPLVLSVLMSYRGFVDVLVVDDGSSDDTAVVAAAHGARVIRHPHNCGKGAAMARGVHEAAGDILFFCDADITGLTHAIIDDIVRPVCERRVAMSIGMLRRPYYRVKGALRFVPLLGGCRALTRSLWNQVPPRFKRTFKIETALNRYAVRSGHELEYRIVPALGQTVKERKYGLWPGLISRARMCWDVVSTGVRLQLSD